jgi:hypothetical protein
MARYVGLSSSPSGRQVAVTPSDSTDLSGSRGLYVGGAGDLTLTPVLGGADVVMKAVPVGTLLPVAVSRVKAATTATFIVALY